MKLRRRLFVAAFFALALAIPFCVFLNRPPVLVVTDLSFVSLYGAHRLRFEAYYSSLVLFRRVKPVIVADDAGEDIIPFAVAEASPRPFCVLFPLRFAKGARQYREKNPEIPAVLLEGRYPAEGVNPAAFAISTKDTADYFVFTTDLDADFYRAGLCAAVLDGDKNGKTAVFLEPHVQKQAKEAFLRAIQDADKTMETVFYTSFSQFRGNTGLSCVVLAGNGSDYLEKYTDVPVIFFTWLDPSMIPGDVILVFNDSPWVQIVPAVRMVSAQIPKGQIQSWATILQSKSIDRDMLEKLKKNAGVKRQMPI
ncbi:MAG: hypothetical protein LBG91_03775 [Treponema sp.]|jgi:hypothetical protein|nr:hypothetical protein [Treponema sp.]